MKYLTMQLQYTQYKEVYIVELLLYYFIIMYNGCYLYYLLKILVLN